MIVRDPVISSDLVDHLHDLEELHERLIHLVRILKLRMSPLLCEMVVKSQNLQVDAVASLLNGTKELCVVFCLHMVLHHFHLGIF